MRCTYCGSSQHPTDYCPKTARGYGNRQRLRCSYCGKKDHNTEACTRVSTLKWDGRGVRLLDADR